MDVAPHPADAVLPYPIRVPEADLDDLRTRLSATRWPDDATADGQGPRLARIQALCAHWATDYDWRRCEDDLNALGAPFERRLGAKEGVTYSCRGPLGSVAA